MEKAGVRVHVDDLILRLHTLLIDSASFSLSNAVVLAKSPFFSSACFAVGIAHKLHRCL